MTSGDAKTGWKAVWALFGERNGFEEWKNRRRDFELSAEASDYGENRQIPERGLDAGRKWKGVWEDAKKRPRRRECRPKAFRNRSIIAKARKRSLPSDFGRKRRVERLRGDERSSRGVRTEPDDARCTRKGDFSAVAERGPRREPSARGYLHSSEKRAERAKGSLGRSAQE